MNEKPFSETWQIIDERYLTRYYNQTRKIHWQCFLCGNPENGLWFCKILLHGLEKQDCKKERLLLFSKFRLFPTFAKLYFPKKVFFR